MFTRTPFTPGPLARSLLALFSLTALPALADYNAGASAYSRKEFDTARTAFLQVAQLADVGAQRALASMYARGEGGAVDLVEAYAWASLASEQGDATAGKIREAIVPSLPAALKVQADKQLNDYRGKYSADAVKRTLHPIVNAAEPAVFDLQVQPAKLRRQGSVEYPERAQEKNEQGYACVSFLVNSNGKPLDIRRYSNQGNSILASAAEKSLASWEFEPEANEKRVGYCVTFLIEDDKTWRTVAQMQAGLSKVRKGDGRSATDYARELAAAQHAITGRVEVQAVTDAWLAAALTGSAEAQFELASRLLRGDGCVMDREKAVRWLKLALAQSFPAAQHYVAVHMANEPAFNLSAQQRKDWLTAAVNAGNPDAALLRAKELLKPGPNQNVSEALVLLAKLDGERDLHVHDWRAYALALSGEFGDAESEAEEALERASEAGLETSVRQTALTALENEQLPPVPKH